MKKDKGKKQGKPKNSNFKDFLKKRAPIYLALVALLIVFVVPELTKSHLEDKLPKNLSEEENKALETLMSYDGPNNKGLTVLQAIKNKISESYPNEKIYDDRRTKVALDISRLEPLNYKITLIFDSYKGEMNLDWNINMENLNVQPNNPESKHIIDIVNFYD